ncbi:PLD nuclease N-terminal domain-containing protein [Nocardiopsis sp. CNT312]|uniref:PLD nuclease N-terminal domain-containing protein n=1 Tax=Nocardiopsis sp. CNT312 TaxID=1137268 RepID=UPI0004B49BBD|nr:PLD nuclease N-terminal domain-containing protein [Nocardiopsis sp. CNT312]
MEYFADATGATDAWFAGTGGVVALAIGLAVLALSIAAILSTLVDRRTTAGGKFLWIVFEVWFPVFGAVAWFAVGRKGHLNRFLGIAKGSGRHSAPASVGQHSDAVVDQVGLGHA